MRAVEAERVDLVLHGCDELAGVGGGFGSDDGVAVVEAVREGDDADQEDKRVDLFHRPAEEEVGVHQHH